MDYESLLRFAGTSGLYQVLMFISISFVALLYNSETLGNNFMAPHHAHWCKVDNLENLTQEQQKYIAIPWEDESAASYSSCALYDLPWTNLTRDDLLTWNRSTYEYTTASQCSQWQFDDTHFTRTVASEWDVVCSVEWLRQLIPTLYLTGCLVGCFSAGPLSDRIGRKSALLVVMAMKVGLGIGSAFAPNILIFNVCRFLMGVLVKGTEVIAFVLLVEILPGSVRVQALGGYMIAYSQGGTLVSLVAFLTRDFRLIMLVLAAISSLVLLYKWFLPESPRWLISKGRYEEALQIIETTAKVNRRKIPEVFLTQYKASLQKNSESLRTAEMESQENKTPSGGIREIMRSRIIRKNFLALSLCMCMHTLVYIGISMNMDSLVGDIYTNVVLGSSLEIPFLLISVLAVNRVGRKKPLIVSLAIAGLASVLTIPLELNTDLAKYSTYTIIVCRSASMASGHIIFTLLAEIFPTPVRQTAASVIGGVSLAVGIISPLIGGPLAGVWLPLPYVIYSVGCLLAGTAAFLLPETLGKVLPETIQEAEDMERVEESVEKPSLKTLGDMTLGGVTLGGVTLGGVTLGGVVTVDAVLASSSSMVQLTEATPNDGTMNACFDNPAFMELEVVETAPTA